MKTNNNKFWIFGFLILLISSLASASLTTDLISYYTFDTNAVDSLGINNGSVSGATLTTGFLGQGYNFDGVNDDIDLGFKSNEQPHSFSFWFKADDTSGDKFLVSSRGGIGSEIAFNANRMSGIVYQDSSKIANTDLVAFTDTSSFHLLLFNFDGSNLTLYLDNVYYSSAVTGTSFTSFTSSTNYFVGSRNGGYFYDGIIDELSFWSRTLNSSERTELWNNGNGLTYNNMTGTSSSSPSNFSVTAKNIYDNTSINNFSIIIDNTLNFNTTTGSINTILLQNDTGLHNITFSSDDYFNKSYVNINVSSNLEGSIFQSIVDFKLKTKVSDTYLTNFSLEHAEGTSSTTNGTIRLYPTANVYSDWNFTSLQGDYIDLLDTTISISALDNKTIINNVYNSILNITLNNAYSNISVENFTGYVYNSDYGFNESFNVRESATSVYEGLSGSYFPSSGSGPKYYDWSNYENAFDSNLLTYASITEDYLELGKTFSSTFHSSYKFVFECNASNPAYAIYTTVDNITWTKMTNTIYYNQSEKTTVYYNNSQALKGIRIYFANTDDSNIKVYEIDSIKPSTANIQLEQGLNYTVYLESEGYSIGSDNTKTILIDNVSEELNFLLYSENSIIMNFFNADSGIKITDTNLSIVVSGNSSEQTYHSVTGSYFVDNLTDGSYTVKISGGNYSLATYIVTVSDRSTQTLNAYLTLSDDTVIFTFINYNTGVYIEAVSFTMSRLINDTLTVVNSKESDITGRIQLLYTPNVKYYFTGSKTGYSDKTFTLDPILFSEYNVKMTPLLNSSNSYDFAGVNKQYYPTSFIENNAVNFSFTISSPDGLLSSYSYNLTFPSGSIAGNGNNSYGGTFTDFVNVTNAIYSDSAILTYSYDTIIGDEKTFVVLIPLVLDDIGEYTLINVNPDDYGLGVLDKVIIAGLIILLFGGIAYFYAGVEVSILIIIFLYGLLVKMNFLPLWSILPSALILFIIAIGRRSG